MLLKYLKTMAKRSFSSVESNIKIEKKASSALKRSRTTPSDDWEPKNWKLVWKGIQGVRDKIIAPVDGMGCSELSYPQDKAT